MEIKTISSCSSENFDKDVNKHLKDGWTPFGEPNITTVAVQSTWDGRVRSRSETTYSLVMKKEYLANK